MNHFAKLFQLDQHQVLVTKEIDATPDDENILLVRSLMDGVEVSVKYNYPTAESRDTRFQVFNLASARSFLNTQLSFIDNLG